MIKITYRFKYLEKDQEILIYHIGLDEENYQFINQEEEDPNMASWTALDFHQCSNCPLNKDQNPQCPIAKNIANLVYTFHDVTSHEKCMVYVETEERIYAKKASVQEGLYSIFGIIMATSGCPHMNFFKPMARFHLPFSTTDETLFRAASIFLLGEYLNGGPENCELKKLKEHYAEVSKVNEGILKRIRSVNKKDADLNALIILDNFAQIIDFELMDDFTTLSSFFK